MSRLPRRARIPLLLIASLLLSVLIAELVLRGIGYSHEESPVSVEFVIFDWAVDVDDDLLWVPKDYQQRFDAIDGPPAIAFMGDSCTDIGNYHAEFMQLLQEKTGASPPHLNLGVGAWSSYQGLQQLKRDVVELQPKIITLYYGWNDHWIGLGDRKVTRATRLRKSPLHKLRLVQLLGSNYLAALHWSKAPDSRRVPINEFLDNHREMVRIARENGIVPVLLTAPSAHHRRWDSAFYREHFLAPGDNMYQLHNDYAARVRLAAAEMDAPLCDLAREFQKIPQRTLETQYFKKDRIHLTEKGDRAIARNLYECFERHDLIRLLEP